MTATQQQSHALVPYVGLQNLGRTGAFNVCLQVLFHLKDFVIELKQLENHVCQEETVCLWCSLHQVLFDMQCTTVNVVEVDKDLHDNFFMGHNGDTYGYLLKVLCRLSHECIGILDNNYDSAPFIQMFDVGLKTHQTCCACGHNKIIFTTKITIDVPISDKATVTVATLSHLLRHTTTLIWCDKCLKFAEHIIVNSLEKNPKILCIRLLRFEDEGLRDKTILKLSENIILPSGSKYSLVGCALHLGDTLCSGQSMALLKCSNGSFRLISDSQVKNVSHESVFSSEVIGCASYLVMFEQNINTVDCEDPDITHISLDLSSMAEQVSIASVHTSLNVTEERPSAIVRQGPWIVSPQTSKATQSSPKTALKNVKRVLNFTSIMSPILEQQESAMETSFISFQTNAEHNSHGNNESASNHLGQFNDSATSYISTVTHVPLIQVPSSRKRHKILKPRALNMETSSNRSDDILHHNDNFSNNSGDKIHDISGCFTVTEMETVTTTKEINKKPISKDRRRSRRHGLPPTVCVTRAVVRYEICCNLPEKKFKFFTGLTQYHFNVLFDLIGGDEGIKNLKYEFNQKTPIKTLPTRKFSSKNRLFLMLVRMRRGVPIIDLAHIFNIGKTQCAAICYAMIRLTYECLSLLQPHMFISAAQQKKHMPACFKRFKNLRVIIDAAEFHIEMPSDFQQQGNTYSSYKHCNTIKFLIGISCYCSIIFCSGGFEGSKSDKEILKSSGMMDYLEKGDSVMADRGFNVKSELAEIGVDLIKPADFNKGKQFLNPQDEVLTKDTATARIYVEHAIKSIKDWRILRNIIPMSIHDMLPDMVFIAAYLTNFNEPYVKLTGRVR